MTQYRQCSLRFCIEGGSRFDQNRRLYLNKNANFLTQPHKVSLFVSKFPTRERERDQVIFALDQAFQTGMKRSVYEIISSLNE